MNDTENDSSDLVNAFTGLKNRLRDMSFMLIFDFCLGGLFFVSKSETD